VNDCEALYISSCFYSRSIFFPVILADEADRIVSVAEAPNSAELGAEKHGVLIELIHALDKVTHTKTKIVIRPFERSLKETAAGLADCHVPLIRANGVPPPEGLEYLEGVELPGGISFVIYSRKQHPLDANTVMMAKRVEIEPGHQLFFPFKVEVTHCIACSLDKLLLGRLDALIIPSNVIDPMLKQAKYKVIHRALYKKYPVSALAPATKDNTAIRRYFIEGLKLLSQSGEFSKILNGPDSYSDWQP
jgi:hypothetical protein